ncbi:MAG: glucosaminidase domain-containing protein [Flavobacteriales bacterium]
MDLVGSLKTGFAALCLTVVLPLFAQGSPPTDPPGGDRLSAEDYIELWKSVAVEKMKQHGIPASITLAQGLLESGNGNSELAREANNHFGIKCTPDWSGGKSYHDDDRKNDCFRKYRDAADSYEDHSKFLQRPRYASLFELKTTDYKGWAPGLKKAGYATDPAYPRKLIELIERYELDKLDAGQDISFRKRETKTEDTAQRSTEKPSGRSRSKKTKASRVGNDEVTFTLGNSRHVEKFEGRVKFTRAKAGDSIRKIAEDMETMPGWVAGWNDLDKDAGLEEGQVIYLSPKLNKSKRTATHDVRAGETLWTISQQYGVKLSKLCAYNNMQPTDTLRTGMVVHLRKPKR